ncbi:MAG: hypothetical protein J6I53_10320 [Treponema sp.]|nr:hypothetical protein [Treponema sp.]
MKNLSVLMMAVAISFGLLACKTNADDNGGNGGSSSTNYETPTAKLPESAGDNEFSGKTWSYSYSYNYFHDIWKFSEDKIERKRWNGYSEDDSNEKETFVYKYTYDSEKMVVYYSFLSYEYINKTSSIHHTYSYSSVNDFVNFYDDLKKYEAGQYYKQGEHEQYIEEAKSTFKYIYAFSYEINSNQQLIIDLSYVPEIFPYTSSYGNDIMGFSAPNLHHMSADAYSNTHENYIDNDISINQLYLTKKTEDPYLGNSLSAFLNFTDTSFTGKVFGWTYYKAGGYDGTIIENFGSVEGIWTANKTDFGIPSISLTFTNAPEEVLEDTNIELNKTYTLPKSSANSSYEIIFDLVTE